MAPVCPPDAPLFLDLDGVLLDVSARYYRLHADLLAGTGAVPVDRETYWMRLRERRPLVELVRDGRAPGLDEEAYRRAWLERIEAPEYLMHDRVVPGTAERLGALGVRHPLVLTTLRRRREGLLAQLDALGLRTFFAEVLTAEPLAGAADAERKRRLIESSPLLRPGAAVVGDTEADVRAGRALGLVTVAVLSGLRSRAVLAAEGPSAIIDSIASLGEAIA